MGNVSRSIEGKLGVGCTRPTYYPDPPPFARLALVLRGKFTKQNPDPIWI
jgi:hypothetical protein